MASRLNPFLRLFAASFLILVALIQSTRPAYGQAGIQLEDVGAVVDFGKSISFHAKIQSALPIQSVRLIFRGTAEGAERVETVPIQPDGSVSFTYDASLNLIAPFSEVIFWFQATLSDNQTRTSEAIRFVYADNRFPWRSASRANVTVHWYAQDDVFGNEALNAAGAGMLAMRDFIPLALEAPIHIYIYANPDDLQTTLALGGADWVGGHAVSDIGVALVSIAPGANPSELQTKIPHELTHIMLHRALGDKYAAQPAWLVEGMASMMEQYANPDYQRALNVASADDTLIPFVKLCETFPPDSGSAFLAYAQSQSFILYISQTYGISGLSRLMNAYSDGLSCELGVTRALGTPLSELETRWREDILGQNVAGVAMRNLFPFLLLMGIVLVVPLWGTVDIFVLRYKRKHAAQPK